MALKLNMRMSKHSRLYNIAIILLGLCVVTIVLFRVSVERVVSAAVDRAMARKALKLWGLEPSEENVGLYLAQDIYVTGRTNNFESPGRPHTVKRRSGSALQFSQNWSYDQLLDQSRISIGVYSQDRAAAKRLERIFGEKERVEGTDVVVRPLQSMDDFLDALEHDDMVMFFGHSNLGRGMFFEDDRRGDGYLHMGNNVLEIPKHYVEPSDRIIGKAENGLVRIKGGSGNMSNMNVRCKVFWYMGCRSEKYFREIWEKHFPRAELVTSNYTWDSTTDAPDFIDSVTSGLNRRYTLDEIIAELNRNRSSEILHGRIDEVFIYKNESDHPSVLLTH